MATVTTPNGFSLPTGALAGWQPLGAAWQSAPAAWREITLAGEPALVLDLHNPTDRPVRVGRLDVLVAPVGFVERPLEDLCVAQTGWQSWSYACPPMAAPDLPLAAPPPMAGPDLPEGELPPWRSPWVAVFQAGDAAVLVGFATAKRFLGTVSWQATPAGHRVVASCHTEGLALAPGETWSSEPLVVLAGSDPQVLLGRYAAIAAAAMGALPAPPTRQGWCSWYEHFQDITAPDVAAAVAKALALRPVLPLDLVQLDDGYQPALGDWLLPSAGFPDGLPPVVAGILGAGFAAGLWVAPFLVGRTSQRAREHPDWVLRDALGEAVVPCDFRGEAPYVLDASHPAARAWLGEVAGALAAQGFSFLKLDYLYAGALAGRRHDPAMTGIMALRAGLMAMRAAAPRATILACGAPFLPLVGLAEVMRVGPDVATHYATTDPTGPSLLNAARGVLAHGWMHAIWWVNDPDCLLLRRDGSDLTEAEVQTWIAIVVLSGGLVMWGDDLTNLPADRRDRVLRLLARLGRKPGHPVGPVIDGLPSAYVRADGDQTILALFNWADHTRPLAWALPPGCYAIEDLFSGAQLEISGGLLLPTPPHGVRLLCLQRGDAFGLAEVANALGIDQPCGTDP